MGANHKGEIQLLTDIARPTIAMILNIGYAHIEHFGDLNATCSAKFEIVNGLASDGTLVVNSDDCIIKNKLFELSRAPYSILRVGHDHACDFRVIKSSLLANKIFITIKYADREGTVGLPFLGAHLAVTLGMAIAAAVAAGIDFMDALTACSDFIPPSGRMQMQQSGAITIIDDSYNASPDAVLAGLKSLEVFNEITKIAVIGEMRELGKFSEECHMTVGEQLSRSASHAILVGGPIMKDTAAFAVTQGMNPAQIWHTTSAPEALRVLSSIINNNEKTLIYIKGSRFRHMERVKLGLLGTEIRCTLEECPLYINCSTCHLLEGK